MPTLRVITLGCSKNTVDTEHLLARVEGAYDILPEDGGEPADVLLINTCGFIGDAKKESIDTILKAGAMKKDGLIGKIGVFGCLSQRYSSELPGLIPEVDAWFGARDLGSVARWLWPDAKPSAGRYMQSPLPYAYLKISEGCDRTCSYCAIPLIRGAHKSVPMEELVSEAQALASKGVRELILIAQDTTFYGLDLYKKRALADLVGRLSEIDGIEWIRIHYSFPTDFPDDVLDMMATNPKVCRYLDIPLQHSADNVLSAMRRGVDGAQTRDLISRIRERVPGIVLRTTMMVGHPGEGRKEFSDLMDFVRWAKFERLGAFEYSSEEDTWSYLHYGDPVSPRTKHSRLRRLMELQRDISLEFNRSRVETRCRVLVDAVMGDDLVCRSCYESPEVDGEILVAYDKAMGRPAAEMPGHFIEVDLTWAGDYDLRGVFIC